MSDAELAHGDALIIQNEWRRRTVAEYGSAIQTHQLVLWLLQLTAPPELVRLGLRIVEDEISHSEVSHRVYRAAGGMAAIDIGPGTLGLQHPSAQQLLDATVSVAVETFCLGETVAVRLFARLRSACSQPDARLALDRIVKDEVRHRDFGWTLLDWLLSTPKQAQVRDITTRTLPLAFERLRENYAPKSPGRVQEGSPVLASWGLRPPADYAAVLEETLTKDYLPLFADLDIDARTAWGAR